MIDYALYGAVVTAVTAAVFGALFGALIHANRVRPAFEPTFTLPSIPTHRWAPRHRGVTG
jgi:hypothetical protein